MNVYERLLQDHKECRDLFAKLDQPQELSTFGRRRFYEDLRLKLVAHDKAEEETYYKAIDGDRAAHDLVEEALHEHSELTRLLDQAAQLPVDDQRWLDCMRQARNMFLRHIEEEEEKIIPRSRAVLSEEKAETIGKDFQNRELRILMAERKKAH
jgi:hemerythrin superfamily protein